MTWLLAGRPQRSMLVTRLRYLGDVVMSTILLEALRAGDPQVRLGYLCEQGHGVALDGHPCLDQVHQLASPRQSVEARARLAHQGGHSARAAGIWTMARELRRAKYDLAVDLFFNPRSAWLLWLSGIKIRIGGTPTMRRYLYTDTVLAEVARQASPELRAVAPGGLGDHLCRLAPLVHAESGLDFLTWVGRQFPPGTLRPRLATGTPINGEPYLLLAPGATWPSKEWPLGNWRKLVAGLSRAGGPRLRLLIPPGREQVWGELAAGYDPAVLEALPPMGLAEVKALLSGARAVVCVDGGVMHMSVALGTPTLALFGPTDPAIWFPYEKVGPYRVLATAPECHPCNLHQCDQFVCLPDLTPGRVLSALSELTAGVGRGEGVAGQ